MSHFKMNGSRGEEESSDSDYKHKRRKTNHMRQPAQNGTQGAGTASPAAPNSFTAKMMAKMGYVEGQGLGATGKGRLAPIETQQRPQGAGLGAVKEKTQQAKAEEKREAAFRGEVLTDSSDEEKKRKRKLKEKRMSGVASGSRTPAGRVKPKYKTASEMEAAAEGLEVPNVLKSIIDATGQETKLLTSAAGLMSSQIAMVPSETEAEKIARRARRDLEAFTDEWRALKERDDYYEAEHLQLSTEIQRDTEEIQDLENVIDAVQHLEKLSVSELQDATNDAAWESITKRLEGLEKSLQSVQDLLALQEVSAAAIHPLFRDTMENWEPLHQTTDIVPYLSRLKLPLGIKPQPESRALTLQNGHSHSKVQSKSTTPYESLVHKYWLPRIRSAITNEWDVYDPEPLVNLIKVWEPVLPPFILANVLDQLVVRRLSDASAKWKPQNAHKHRRRTQPQAWLFPWLELLDEQHTNPKSSTGLLADVKRKLKTVITSWDLNSAILPGLESWKSVFHSDLSSILVRHLLPRLSSYLAENFAVDPSDQDLNPLEKVLQWKPYFSPDAMSQLFVTAFFPKWHETLYIWLTSTAANFDEISQWYQWWKETLEAEAADERRPGSFNDVPEIAAEWSKGVEAINRAIDALENGLDVASNLEPPSIGDKGSTPAVSTPIIEVPTSKPVIIEMPTTFKDVVEDWCAENDLHLIALREADLQSGLPLFRITASASGKGGVVVYLKGDVVWVRQSATAGSEERVYMPMGLDDALAAKAERR